MEIKKIESHDKKILNEIVDIHLETFTGFFLTFMGRGFLSQMYSSYFFHKESDILVACEDDHVVGFLAYSLDMSGLYKYMIKHRLVQFGWYSIGAIFRRPKSFMRLIRAFLKPSEANREEKYVEISSIGISPSKKGRGIGSQLIHELKNSIDCSKYDYIALETDAVGNDAVNNFYIKNGFTLIREYKTLEGRRMNEYRLTV